MLKAKGVFAQRMATLGGEEWTYERKDGKQSAMPYWTLPDAMLDDPQAACALAREASDAPYFLRLRYVSPNRAAKCSPASTTLPEPSGATLVSWAGLKNSGTDIRSFMPPTTR